MEKSNFSRTQFHFSPWKKLPSLPHTYSHTAAYLPVSPLLPSIVIYLLIYVFIVLIRGRLCVEMRRGDSEISAGAWWMRGVSGCWESRVALICHRRGAQGGSTGARWGDVWGMVCGSRGPLGIQKSDDHGRGIHTVPLGNTKLSVLRACVCRTYTRQMQAAAVTLTALRVESVCLY